jgi:S-layer homology domain
VSGRLFLPAGTCFEYAGIVAGYNTTPPCENSISVPCFKPYNGSTGGQISKIVSLAAGFSEQVSGQTFEDVLPGSTFYPYIERMVLHQIIAGYPCGGAGEPCDTDNRPCIRGGKAVTRGQLSKMMVGAFAFGEPVTGQAFEDVPIGSTFYEYIGRMAARGIIMGYACGQQSELCVPPTTDHTSAPAVQ